MVRAEAELRRRADEAAAHQARPEFRFAPPANYRELWVTVLTMAVRDDATSVEYFPVDPSVGNIWYVADRTRYELVPFPHEHVSDIVEAARVLAMPGRRATLRWRLGGLFGSRAAAGVFTFSVGGRTSRWVCGVWRTGEWQGVDFRRLDAPPGSEAGTPVEPPWWDFGNDTGQEPDASASRFLASRPLHEKNPDADASGS